MTYTFGTFAHTYLDNGGAPIAAGSSGDTLSFTVRSLADATRFGTASVSAGTVFYIWWDNEILKVTSGGAGVISWTAIRGQFGTTATAHADGSAIRETVPGAVFASFQQSGAPVTTPLPHLWQQAISPGAPSTVTTATLTSDVKYNGFPGLCVTRSGKLIVGYREGASHNSVDGKITLQKSTDGGATWSAKTYIESPASGHDYRDVSLTCTATGRVICTYFDNVGGTSTACVVYLSYSDDDGSTWSTPTALSGFSSWSATSGPVLQHSSGALLMPIYGQNTGDTGAESFDRIGVLRSADDGLTWSALATIGAADTGLSEMCFVELPNRSVRAYIRHNVYPGSPYSSLSTDAGLTWTTPAAIGVTMANSRPGAALFPISQELILTNGDQTTGGVVYYYSTDLGATWSSVQTVTAGTSEYAALCPLGDHLMGMVYAVEVSAGQADIHFETLAAGVPVVAGSQNGNPAVASLLAALAKEGVIIDTSTTGTAPHGIPAGGTTGQSLTKIDGTDYNVQWADDTDIGGADHVHGLARWIAAGGTTFELPDVAEYLEMAYDNGSAVDSATVTLSSNRTQIIFDVAPTAGHILQAAYVIARI